MNFDLWKIGYSRLHSVYIHTYLMQNRLEASNHIGASNHIIQPTLKIDINNLCFTWTSIYSNYRCWLSLCCSLASYFIPNDASSANHLPNKEPAGNFNSHKRILCGFFQRHIKPAPTQSRRPQFWEALSDLRPLGEPRRAELHPRMSPEDPQVWLCSSGQGWIERTVYH